MFPTHFSSTLVKPMHCSAEYIPLPAACPLNLRLAERCTPSHQSCLHASYYKHALAAAEPALAIDMMVLSNTFLPQSANMGGKFYSWCKFMLDHIDVSGRSMEIGFGTQCCHQSFLFPLSSPSIIPITLSLSFPCLVLTLCCKVQNIPSMACTDPGAKACGPVEPTGQLYHSKVLFSTFVMASTNPNAAQHRFSALVSLLWKPTQESYVQLMHNLKSMLRNSWALKKPYNSYDSLIFCELFQVCPMRGCIILYNCYSSCN